MSYNVIEIFLAFIIISYFSVAFYVTLHVSAQHGILLQKKLV